MAVICTLANARKWRWIVYIVASAVFSGYCYYDGWISDKYKEELSNLWFNRVAAIVLAITFVILIIVYFFKISKTRVLADDSGIDVNGALLIKWDAISKVDDTYLEKGLLDIFYIDDNGKERKWTADDYKITNFDDLLDEVSKHRPDVLPPAEQEESQK